VSSASAWDEVWERKGALAARTGSDPMAAAIAANGFDSPGADGVGPDDFRALAAEVVAAAGMAGGHSVYEVGCGAGAFLASLDAALPGLSLAGCDRSASLVRAGRALFPSLALEVADAAELPAAAEADHLLACSVLHYFPDHDYAKRVIDAMAERAARSVTLLDLPDAALRDADEAARRSAWGDEAYAARYEGLDHLTYDREWVASRFRPDVWRVRVTAQSLTRYPNAPYRFNVVAVRASGSRPS